MRVQSVSAVVRYSAEVKGAWRSIEVGAEAVLNASDETLESTQAELYRRLSQQLKALWSNGRADNTQAQPTQASTPLPDCQHWCSQHRVEHKRFSKNGKVWFAHRLGDGSWCNESRKS